jgi:hypothetical protein
MQFSISCAEYPSEIARAPKYNSSTPNTILVASHLLSLTTGKKQLFFVPWWSVFTNVVLDTESRQYNHYTWCGRTATTKFQLITLTEFDEENKQLYFRIIKFFSPCKMMLIIPVHLKVQRYVRKT